jgi:hypothetical protein
MALALALALARAALRLRPLPWCSPVAGLLSLPFPLPFVCQPWWRTGWCIGGAKACVNSSRDSRG